MECTKPDGGLDKLNAATKSHAFNASNGSVTKGKWQLAWKAKREVELWRGCLLKELHSADSFRDYEYWRMLWIYMEEVEDNIKKVGTVLSRITPPGRRRRNGEGYKGNLTVFLFAFLFFRFLFHGNIAEQCHLCIMAFIMQ